MDAEKDSASKRTDSFAQDTCASSRQVSARKASNFALGFLGMEKSRAKDLEIFYAYCRILDDISDDVAAGMGEKRNALLAWKREIETLYERVENNSQAEISALALELEGMVRRRGVPQKYMQDVIDGVMRDTESKEFETFEDLKGYCYGVASAVGLVCIYIFGFKNEKTKLFAETLGYAFQFTNILRDVVEDFHKQGRVYVPREELRRFGVDISDLADPRGNPNCIRLFRMHFFRAKHFFNKARRLVQPEDKRSLTPAFIMWEIYETILDKISESGFAISKDVIKLSKWKKITLALRGLKRAKEPERADKRCGRVAVLGAGVAGMATAVELAYAGFDVEVFEAKAQTGGRASSFEWAACGARLDNGSHALMGVYDNFFSFVNRFGVEGAFFPPSAAMDFYFKGGKKMTVSFPAQGVSKLKGLIDVLKFGEIEGFLASSNIALFLRMKLGGAKAKKGENARAYLERFGVNQSVITGFWEPFCVATLNTKIELADANILRTTVRESVLRGMGKTALVLPKRPLAESFYPDAEYYLNCVGGRLNLSQRVKALEFEGEELKAFETSEKRHDGFDYAVSALNWKALAKLLPEGGGLQKRVAKIGGADILNVHFTTPKKLFEGNFACLMGSPLHWIFDHSHRLPEDRRATQFLYSLTVSANDIEPSREKILELTKSELTGLFGDFEIGDFIHILCKDATISADSESEGARPAPFGHFKNFFIAGDWVDSDLPCTLESAAKSARLIAENL